MKAAKIDKKITSKTPEKRSGLIASMHRKSNVGVAANQDNAKAAKPQKHSACGNNKTRAKFDFVGVAG